MKFVVEVNNCWVQFKSEKNKLIPAKDETERRKATVFTTPAFANFVAYANRLTDYEIKKI